MGEDPNWLFEHGDGVDGLLAHGPVDHTVLDPPPELGGADPFRDRVSMAVAASTRRWVLVFCPLEASHLWSESLLRCGMSYCCTGIYEPLGGHQIFTDERPDQRCEAIVISHSGTFPQRWYGTDRGEGAKWSSPSVRRDDREHPEQKPVVLMRQLLRDFTEEGETVADLFGGVATTGVAAVSLGRKFVGWETNAAHYATGIKRLELRLPDPDIVAPMGPPRRRGAAAHAREQLDRKVLNAIGRVGEGGIPSSDLVDIVGEMQDRKSTV